MRIAKTKLFLDWLVNVVRGDINNVQNEANEKYFENTIKYFLNFGNIQDKKSFLDGLSKYRNILNASLKSKIIECIVNANNRELLYIAAAVYESNSDHGNLLELIKCLKNNNLDYKYHAAIAYGIINYSNLDLVDKFISILEISKTDFVANLVNQKRFTELKVYIITAGPILSFYETQNICSQLGFIINNSCNSSEMYLLYATIAEKCVMFDLKFFDLLIPTCQARQILTDCCYTFSGFTSYLSCPILLTKYISYLYFNYNWEYITLENRILVGWLSPALNAFANHIPFCSKRKFLERLCTLNATEDIANFISMNPQFKKLLPML